MKFVLSNYLGLGNNRVKQMETNVRIYLRIVRLTLNKRISS